MSEVAKLFGELTRALNYPVFIVTAADGERREGCVIGFATQTSLHPGRFLACLSRENRTYRLAQEVGALAVHLVPRERARPRRAVRRRDRRRDRQVRALRVVAGAARPADPRGLPELVCRRGPVAP